MFAARKVLVWLCLITLVSAWLWPPDVGSAHSTPINTWKKVTNATSHLLWRVSWEQDRFIASGDNGTILISADGQTWSETTGLINGRINGIVLGDHGYVAVGGEAPDNGKIVWSADGVNWEQRPFSGYTLSGVAWGNNKYVAVGNHGTILTSEDGRNWTPRSAPGMGSSYHFYSVIWADNKFVAVGGQGGGNDRVLTSNDGITWEVSAAGSKGYLRGIVWGGNQFVAVGEKGKVRTSSDGYTWQGDHPTGFAGDLWDVTWGNNQYVAVGVGGAILTSLDGVSWTVETPLGGNTLYGITSVDKQYVAVGAAGAVFYGSYAVNDFKLTTDLSDKSRTSRTLTFQWTPPEDASWVVVQQSIHGQNDWKDAATSVSPVPVNATGAVVIGLTPDTEYDVRLKIGRTWYDGENFEDISNVVTARTLPEYTVTFDVYGGTPTIAPVKVQYNGTVTQPSPDPVKTGHTFAGWYADPSYLTAPFDFAGTPIQSDITLFAKWDINYYTVTFDVYGGTPVPDQTVAYLGSVIEPSPPPTKPGYTFGGWFTNATYDTPFDFANSVVTVNMTVYGKWTTNTYTVSFDVDGGSPVNNQYVLYLDYVKEPVAPVKTGYTFAGWYTDSTYTVQYDFKNFQITDHTTIYAKWLLNQYEVIFETNGGTPVPSVRADHGTFIAAPVSPTRSGYSFEGWHKTANLDEEWLFDRDIVTSDMTLFAAWSRNSSGGGSDPGTPSQTDEDPGFEIIINGSREDQWARAVATEQEGKPIITIAFDNEPFLGRIRQEPDFFTVIVPVKHDADAVMTQLDGRLVKFMGEKRAVLEIQSKAAIFTLPVQFIRMDAISEKFGSVSKLWDIKFNIEIAASSYDKVRMAEFAAMQGGSTIVVQPLDFKVKATHGDSVIEISHYSSYVTRMIALPDDADPTRITTAVAVEPDGTIRHVPTKAAETDGKHYAEVNSLTDGTFTVIRNPVQFNDAAGHWARDVVNDMGSRLVISGIGRNLFKPDQDITRAEFAAMIVRGLGLRLENGSDAPFRDVGTTEWYSSAVQTAYRYNLINGFEDGTFRPTDNITREQAMTMIANAMNMTGLKGQLPPPSVESLLEPFVKDAHTVSAWARDSIADCLQAGIVAGRSSTELAPQSNITRAESAALIQRLLRNSDLI